MPETDGGTQVANPSLDAGDVGDALLPCDTNDVEVVSDLDEPNGIQAECDFKDEEPVGLLFAAEAIEPDGQAMALVNILPRQDGTI
jgi:hypothetical protein